VRGGGWLTLLSGARVALSHVRRVAIGDEKLLIKVLAIITAVGRAPETVDAVVVGNSVIPRPLRLKVPSITPVLIQELTEQSARQCLLQEVFARDATLDALVELLLRLVATPQTHAALVRLLKSLFGEPEIQKVAGEFALLAVRESRPTDINVPLN
jgi:hypothetical protein